MESSKAQSSKVPECQSLEASGNTYPKCWHLEVINYVGVKTSEARSAEVLKHWSDVEC
jgi:hypothetical protein